MIQILKRSRQLIILQEMNNREKRSMRSTGDFQNSGYTKIEYTVKSLMMNYISLIKTAKRSVNWIFTNSFPDIKRLM